MNIAHKIADKKRTGDVLISEEADFSSLLLSKCVLRGLQNAGFERPSPIQLKAIPLGRCGLDLIVQAKSGTGKTCVFAVVSLESIQIQSSAIQVLVLAPTREIALQIWEVIKTIGSDMPALKCHTFIGGLPLQEDKTKIKKCQIAIGTPGRVKQLIEMGVLKTESIRLFVLDEADKLLEDSFQEQINWIYSALPENKQMLALSATYPESLAQHLTRYMRNPTFMRLNISDPALLGIRQFYKIVEYSPMANLTFESKAKAVIEVLSGISFQQCLIFSNLQTRAQNLSSELEIQGWPTACIAGSHDQKDRIAAMSKLKTYKCRVLISTDLTSRGIDADKVNLVINLDLPKDHETYLHRIGRAGRFGSFGAAITMVSEGKEEDELRAIERKCNTSVKKIPDPLPMDLLKVSVRIRLDDVVSTEQLVTRPKTELDELGSNPNSDVTLGDSGGISDACGPVKREVSELKTESQASSCETEGKGDDSKLPEKANILTTNDDDEMLEGSLGSEDEEEYSLNIISEGNSSSHKNIAEIGISGIEKVIPNGDGSHKELACKQNAKVSMNDCPPKNMEVSAHSVNEKNGHEYYTTVLNNAAATKVNLERGDISDTPKVEKMATISNGISSEKKISSSASGDSNEILPENTGSKQGLSSSESVETSTMKTKMNSSFLKCSSENTSKSSSNSDAKNEQMDRENQGVSVSDNKSFVDTNDGRKKLKARRSRGSQGQSSADSMTQPSDTERMNIHLSRKLPVSDGVVSNDKVKSGDQDKPDKIQTKPVSKASSKFSQNAYSKKEDNDCHPVSKTPEPHVSEECKERIEKVRRSADTPCEIMEDIPHINLPSFRDQIGCGSLQESHTYASALLDYERYLEAEDREEPVPCIQELIQEKLSSQNMELNKEFVLNVTKCIDSIYECVLADEAPKMSSDAMPSSVESPVGLKSEACVNTDNVRVETCDKWTQTSRPSQQKTVRYHPMSVSSLVMTRADIHTPKFDQSPKAIAVQGSNDPHQSSIVDPPEIQQADVQDVRQPLSQSASKQDEYPESHEDKRCPTSSVMVGKDRLKQPASQDRFSRVSDDIIAKVKQEQDMSRSCGLIPQELNERLHTTRNAELMYISDSVGKISLTEESVTIEPELYENLSCRPKSRKGNIMADLNGYEFGRKNGKEGLKMQNDSGACESSSEDSSSSDSDSSSSSESLAKQVFKNNYADEASAGRKNASGRTKSSYKSKTVSYDLEEDQNDLGEQNTGDLHNKYGETNTEQFTPWINQNSSWQYWQTPWGYQPPFSYPGPYGPPAPHYPYSGWYPQFPYPWYPHSNVNYPYFPHGMYDYGHPPVKSAEERIDDMRRNMEFQREYIKKMVKQK